MPTNLLLIMCDEMRWAEAGCYGHPVVQTPHLDAMARRGTLVEHAVSNCPVCLPARSIVLSGQHARTAASIHNAALHGEFPDGRRRWVFDAYAPPTRVAFPDPTLPELLRAAGYHTRAVGKWHVEAWPHHLGFDDYLIPRTHHAHSAQLFTHNGGPEFAAPGFSVDFEADRVCNFLRSAAGLDTGPTGTFDSPASVDASVAHPADRLDTPLAQPPHDTPAPTDQPWFMYYNISPPHMPLADMPDRYRRMYHPDDVQLRGNVDPDALAAGDGFYRSLDEVFRTYLWDYRDYYNQMPHSQRLPEGFGIRDLMALYYGAITWVDDTLGRVLQTLEQTGQADDTLVVFTADHGDNFASHGRFGKGQLLEESCRIPMAWQGPGVQPQHWDAGVASLVDLAPTLLDAAGVDIPDHMHGRSLQPMLTGTGDGPAEAYIESGGDGVGVRTPTHLFGLPWTGGENPGPREIDPAGKPHRFHDFNADPLQQHSISPADAPELADDLRERLTSWHANTPWRTSPAAQPV